jgi:hypothetical protein
LLAVVVLGGAAAVALAWPAERGPKFCTLGLALAPGTPSIDGHPVVLEDQGSDGADGCEIEPDGSNVDPVVRAEDCVVVYPDGWQGARPLGSIPAMHFDGTCWRSAG